MINKEIVYLNKGFLAIIVIGIYHGKRLIDELFARKHCLTCSPWLCPTLRKLPAVWNILQRLESIADLYTKLFAFTFNAVSDDITEVLFYCTPDNENDRLSSQVQQNQRKNFLSTSKGVRKLRRFLGRLLIISTKCCRSSSVTSAKEVPFGKNCRSRPLVFSFVPRCQGE